MLLFTEVEFTKIIFRMGLHRMRVKLGWQNLKGVDYNSENFNIAGQNRNRTRAETGGSWLNTGSLAIEW